MLKIFSIANDGGPAITYPILLILLVILVLFVIEIIYKREQKTKTISLLTHLGWFAVAWGFLGRTFGLISAFDKVEASGELTPSLLAEGLKMALVDPLFGLIVFLVARACILVLVGIKK